METSGVFFFQNNPTPTLRHSWKWLVLECKSRVVVSATGGQLSRSRFEFQSQVLASNRTSWQCVGPIQIHILYPFASTWWHDIVKCAMINNVHKSIQYLIISMIWYVKNIGSTWFNMLQHRFNIVCPVNAAVQEPWSHQVALLKAWKGTSGHLLSEQKHLAADTGRSHRATAVAVSDARNH